MARGRGKLHKVAGGTIPRRSTRRAQGSTGVPDVFQDMLDEQATENAATDINTRPLKKRKTAASQKTILDNSEKDAIPVSKPTTPTRPQVHPQSLAQSRTQQRTSASTRVPLRDTVESDDYEKDKPVRQTIIDSSESDDSDMEWEDALVEDADGNDGNGEPEINDISITLGDYIGEEPKTKKQVRRRAITAVEKKLRLDIHKMHFLCLLYHVHRRNTWCNDERVHAVLRKIPQSKALSYLVPDPNHTQYQTSKRFVDGMTELRMQWSKRFITSSRGMYKPRWSETDADARPFSDFDELDDPMDKDEFRTVAHTLRGSQDLGAQLFCALLRSIGVEARLICSLQCLPFASAAQPSTPQKPSDQKKTVVLDPYNTQAAASPSKPKSTSSRSKKLSRMERVLGERHPVLHNAGNALTPKNSYRSSYPVYWIEAFDSARQRWVPIDPFSTNTTNAAEKLEPPLNSIHNTLTYAIAFEEDHTAKDVTRRYAKAYNAKTRKYRVECTPEGDKWLRRALKMFRRSPKLDRDQVEDAALARKEGAEGIPKNVQDFKGHPVYVLERHLKHNEVIHPLHQAGKVNVGSAMNPKMEPIYRRKDVHIVRSADKWYRLGRDVKEDEQPLKHAKPKKGRRVSIGPDETIEDVQDEVGAALYALFQTTLYIPPPVVRGRVPRNAYGNLDLYVPSMCPPGGIHVRHKLAAKAARIVGVDYADAVTGFSFKGRQGTAIVQGVVVAQEYADSVKAVLDGMEYAQEEAEMTLRRSEAMRLWRRFFLGLKIAQRVNAIEIDGERGPQVDVQEEIEREDKELAEKEFAGGFFPDEGNYGETAVPTTLKRYEPPEPSLRVDRAESAGGFVPEEEEPDIGDDDNNAGSGGGFVPDHSDDGADNTGPESSILNFGSALLAEQQLRPRRKASFGDGFMPTEDFSGGFLPEAVASPGPSTRNANPGNTIPQSDGAGDDDIGGGFIPDEKAATARAGGEGVDESVSNIQEASPTAKLQPENVEHTQSVPSVDKGKAPATDLSDQTVQENVPDPPTTPPETPSPPDPSSPSEAGSLEMEDPEDEDADPDWLVDAT